MVLVGKCEGTRPDGRRMRRWEDSIKMDLQLVGWKGMDWIDLAQDRELLKCNTVGIRNSLTLGLGRSRYVHYCLLKWLPMSCCPPTRIFYLRLTNKNCKMMYIRRHLVLAAEIFQRKLKSESLVPGPLAIAD